MITLNTEKGLVRIESWDDIASRPGFLATVDPKTAKLKEIIGSYSFDVFIPCGLSTCHQPHGTGFLVVTETGHETNIGRICGKRHFSVEFSQMSRQFLGLVRAQQNRELLKQIKHRLAAISAEVATLRTEPLGAAWMYPRIGRLTGALTGLPQPIVNAVREAIRRDGSLVRERAASQEERERQAVATQIIGLERRERITSFVSERVGQLEGIAALAPSNTLRDALGAIEPFLSTLEQVDVDSLAGKELRDLARLGGALDANLDLLRSLIAAGRRLLTRSNLQQLAQFARLRSDSQAFERFLRELP